MVVLSRRQERLTLYDGMRDFQAGLQRRLKVYR